MNFIKSGLLFMAFTTIANGADTQDGSDVYILKTGKTAAKTLDAQHQLFAKDSCEHLKKAGLAEGQTVWDIGCGSGVMTEYLARTVGDRGHVYALDVSQAQLKVSQDRINQASLKNVTFLHGEITSVQGLPIGEAQIVYARLVLMHLVNPDAALEKMRLLLKPGGVLALQESIMSTGHTSVKNDAIDAYIKTTVALGKHNGVDFDIGERLHTLCQKAGLTNVQSYYLQHHLLASQAKPLLLSRSFEWEDKALNANLATRDQIDQWRAAIQMFPESDPSFYFASAKQAYIVAEKGE